MNSLRLMQLYYAGEAQCVAWGQRLALPEFSEWQQAGQSAWNDTRQALTSLGHFWFITFRPLCILLSLVSHAVSQWMWRYVLRPFYFQILVPYSQLFYEKVLLVAYRNGLSQAKEYSIRFWQWQTTRTREELLIEAGVLASLVLLVVAIRWLQRQRYLTRITLWYQAKKRRTLAWFRKQKNKAIQSYRQFFERLARLSQVVAAMGPHVLFLAGAVGMKCLCPSLITYLATESYLRLVVSVLVPLFFTIDLVSNRMTRRMTAEQDDEDDEEKEREQDKENAQEKPTQQQQQHPVGKDAKKDKNALNTASPTTTMTKTKTSSEIPRYSAKTISSQNKSSSGVFPRTSPASQNQPTALTPPKPTTTTTTRRSRRSLVPPVVTKTKTTSSADETTKETLTYWIEYWTVHAGVQVVKRLLSLFSIPFLHRVLPASLLAELDLLLYVWLFAVPLLWPRTLTIEGRPLIVLSQWIRPVATECHHHIAQIVPETLWQRLVVDPASAFLRLASTLRMLSPSTVETCIHLLTDGRALIVPLLMVFVPVRLVSTLALCYTKYILGISKCSSIASYSHIVTLQYWSLHAVLSLCLDYTGLHAILWWIPFSQCTLFLVWWYLTMLPAIEQWYALLEWELVCFHLVEALDKETHVAKHERSRAAQLLEWLVELLPKKVEEDGNEHETKDARGEPASDGDHVKTVEDDGKIMNGDVAHDKRDKNHVPLHVDDVNSSAPLEKKAVTARGQAREGDDQGKTAARQIEQTVVGRSVSVDESISSSSKSGNADRKRPVTSLKINACRHDEDSSLSSAAADDDSKRSSASSRESSTQPRRSTRLMDKAGKSRRGLALGSSSRSPYSPKRNSSSRK